MLNQHRNINLKIAKFVAEKITVRSIVFIKGKRMFQLWSKVYRS